VASQLLAAQTRTQGVPLIARAGHFIHPSMKRAIELLVLLAMILMPFGMSAGAAPPVTRHAMAMPTQHCPEQAPDHRSKGAFTECTMACSAALPAADCDSDEPPLRVGEPVRPSAIKQLHGLHPETATPPPRTA
jgi:hypothetical protein